MAEQTTQDPPAINPFVTPVIEPKPLEEPKESSFMTDITKAFDKAVAKPDGTPAAETPDVEPSPQPKEPAKAEEPPADEPPAHFTPKAKDDWRKKNAEFRSEMKFKNDRIHELEGELKTGRKSLEEIRAQLEGATQGLAEKEARLERFDIEHSQLFRQKVTEPRDTVRGKLEKLVEGTPLADQVERLVGGDLRTREGILESSQLTSYRKGQVVDLLERWDSIDEDRKSLLANGKRSYEEFVQRQQENELARKAQFTREAQQIFEDQCVDLMPRMEAYTKTADDEKWNQGVDVLKSWARKIYSGDLDRKQLAEAAILAPSAIVYRNLFIGFRTRCEELQGQINKMKGVQPTVRDSGIDRTPTPGTSRRAEGDFVASLVDRFNKEAG